MVYNIYIDFLQILIKYLYIYNKLYESNCYSKHYIVCVGPSLPHKYDTFRRLRVTVSKSHLTQVRLSIPDDLFSNANGNIQYYSIIIYQDGGFPDKPEQGFMSNYDVWPPVMRSWAEAAPYPFILPYQTTPDKWMPFKS